MLSHRQVRAVIQKRYNLDIAEANRLAKDIRVDRCNFPIYSLQSEGALRKALEVLEESGK